ncbi:MAG: acyl-ACP--UDP-N-acetylglucosamine O-acyltransferase [Planctomycetota bacterium]|nr:acyl-ACP--UDP-N-acetylglucosamine O-acyltransferase [Planctomycetota bacterium]
MTTSISELAQVDPHAVVGNEVEIGPFCFIGPHVRIGDGTHLVNNVTLTGHVTLGRNNQLFPGVVIGAEPQDLSYQGSPTQVVIGDSNIFRECVTVNRGTEKEDGITSIGNNNYFMACSHVAHDCKLGDYIVMANNSLLGGHVHVGDHVTISGSVAVHHFATIGAYGFIGGLSRVLHDTPPYTVCDGNPARPRSINVVALKRNNFPADEIRALHAGFKLIFRAKVDKQIVRDTLAGNEQLVPSVNHILNFLDNKNEGRNGRARQARRAA